MICITIERLTLFNFFFYILPHFIFLKWHTPRKIIRVCFIDATPLGRVVAQGVLALFSISVQPLAFRLLDLRNEKGDLLRLTVLYGDLLHLQQQFCEDHFFKEILNASDRHQKYFHAYLKKSTVCSDAAALSRLLMVIHASSWRFRRQQTEAEERILFVDRRVWMKSLKMYARQQGVSLRPMGHAGLTYKKMLKTVIGEERIKCLYAFLYRSKIISPAVDPRGDGEEKLVLEYYGSFHLDGPEHYSDFAFWQQSSFSGKDILVSSQLTNAPFNKAQCQLMRAQGMNAVALHPKATLTDQVPVFCRWKQNTGTDTFSLKVPGAYPQEAQWAHGAQRDFHHQVQYYRSFFDTCHAKIYLSWFKYSAHHIAIAEAIGSLGGVMAMYQRAMEQAPCAETAAYCDVFFGFSALGGDIERRSGSRIPYYVITGYLGDHRFALLRKPALQLRQKLMAAGARRIMAFFDENSGDDPRWHVGHEFTRQNYAFVLEKVLNEADFGLVIKPKTPATLRQRLGPCFFLLEKALATGRCFVYDQQHIYSTYPPAIAALSVDITVHGHLCAATAGLESALAGVPTLLLDREGWRECSLYRLGEGKIVFRSWEDLWRSCCEHWRGSGGITGLGDWTAFLPEFDPFRDGKACERMGTYLQWLLQGYKTKMPREQVLAQAGERYTRQWGKDKIMVING